MSQVTAELLFQKIGMLVVENEIKDLTIKKITTERDQLVQILQTPPVLEKDVKAPKPTA